MTKLFDPITVGDVTLANRVMMAPLTRNRARAEDDAPYDIHADYYAQRAGAGLIISEATQISPEGKGYAWTPGIYSASQIEGWKAVTAAVHAKGGKIALQLWHVGRISHTSLQPNGQAPVAPSAIAAGAKTFDGEGFVDTSTPRALELSEIPRLVEEYRVAARNAIDAGFDLVEVHAANGYLIDQFMKDGANKREDAYGGSVENRVRLLREILTVVAGEVGAGRTGVRFSPFSNANEVTDSDPMATFTAAMDVAENLGIAYVHMVEGQTGGSRDLDEGLSLETLKSRYTGTYIANNGYTRDMAIEAVDAGKVDAVAFGVPFIANPDLPERLRRNADLNAPDQSTFYGGGREGYTDYPTLDDAA